MFGIGANADIAACIESAMNDFTESFPEKSKMPLCGERELSTPSYFAYIKIAEGCDNKCTYCAIPMIRGGYRSRTMESIEEEARGLVENGAKELILIAQDTTRYGIDLYGEYSLAKLMRRLCKIDGLKWLRVLYCYPDALTDELLETMAEEEKIVKYIDLPLQHASARVLKRMNDNGAFFCDSIGFQPIAFDESQTQKPDNLMRVVYVEPHKAPYIADVAHTLEAEQKAVGDGLIEPIDNDDGTCLVGNEESKLRGMDGNRRIGDGSSIMAGPFFVCGDSGETFRSLTDEEVTRYMARFAEPEDISPEEVEADMGFMIYPM